MNSGNATAKITDMITKFFYKNNRLCFQILLHVGEDKNIMFSEHTDYAEYKAVFDDLNEKKKRGDVIKVPGISRELTNMIFS